jgi:hypothetical protein
MRRLSPCVTLLLCLSLPGLAGAQTIETVGERALGMGGAFVAVADDSTATWWNPAALATGPFLDLGIGWAATEQRIDGDPVGRRKVTAVSLSTPPLGLSYYRFRITDIQPPRPIETAAGNREEGRAGVVHGLTLHDLGVTLLTSVFTGVHVGTTLKFLHGRVEHTTGGFHLASGALLDLADDASGERSQWQFDADVGALAVTGPFRVGAVVRNLRAAEFDDGAGLVSIRLPRQARVGVAYDSALRRTNAGAWVVSADVDVVSYTTGAGDRRVIAAGAERWLFGERLGIRGGGRFNQVGEKERSATAGVSAAIRPGMLVESHLVVGGADDERGWGVGARFSF